MDIIFSLSFLLVAPFWVLIIILPGWQGTKRVIHSPLVIVPAALLYVILILPMVGDLMPAFINPTLDTTKNILTTDRGLTAGWAHYLAFDLFVGRWIYLDRQARNISIWVTTPALFFTAVMGPLGFLIYIVIRLSNAHLKA